MGALKNAVKRKTHKERSQPLARRKYGLLEKKRDYRERAKDFHKKEQTIQALRRKAEERNPDEFYFAMENARTKDGVHIQPSVEANKYTQEELRLMKSQDVKYLVLKAQTEAKKVERLQQSLHFIGAPTQSKHTVFVDDERSLRGFSAEEHFQTPAELLPRAFNRPRREQLERETPAPASQDMLHNQEKQDKRRYRELVERSDRQQKLAGLAAKLTFAKELMGKGAKKKLKPKETAGDMPVFKWRLERKK